MNAQPDPRDIVRRILEVAEGYEFRTFVVGFRAAGEGPGESRHRKVKSAVGLELCRRWPKRRVDFERPEIRFDVKADLAVELRPAPLFLAGRYRKLSRAIPASRWIHLACKGCGCEGCNFTGNLCGPSVQELFSGPLLRATGGEETFFHGLGREDTDARMLGRGRPFVLELRRPRRRSLDLDELVRATTDAGRGLCELIEPKIVDRSAVKLVKEAAAEKTYRAWIRFERSPPPNTAQLVESLGGREIEQYSPTRVMHRRGASKLRRRRIKESTWIGEIDAFSVWEVRAESGTYIKELVSGDEERTRPSLSEILGVRAKCAALDVLEIHWEAPWEKAHGGVPGSADDSAAGRDPAARGMLDTE